ncbi:hypothetical protein [Streptomyces sp. NPDC059744]|uniref:hypothetical protein n=1 Tax=Streptomyces sp. NPDC059744 TaxID=3346929 RepID=UPI00365350A6
MSTPSEDLHRAVADVMQAHGYGIVSRLINGLRLKQLPYCLHGPVVLMGAVDDAADHTDVPEPLRDVLPKVIAALATRYAPATS